MGSTGDESRAERRRGPWAGKEDWMNGKATLSSTSSKGGVSDKGEDQTRDDELTSSSSSLSAGRRRSTSTTNVS